MKQWIFSQRLRLEPERSQELTVQFPRAIALERGRGRFVLIVNAPQPRSEKLGITTTIKITAPDAPIVLLGELARHYDVKDHVLQIVFEVTTDAPNKRSVVAASVPIAITLANGSAWSYDLQASLVVPEAL